MVAIGTFFVYDFWLSLVEVKRWADMGWVEGTPGWASIWNERMKYLSWYDGLPFVFASRARSYFTMPPPPAPDT
jgi:hypothetical protein